MVWRRDWDDTEDDRGEEGCDVCVRRRVSEAIARAPLRDSSRAAGMAWRIEKAAARLERKCPPIHAPA
jgi:hypothetical protein